MAGLDDLIKFRAPSHLVKRLARIAEKLRREPADLYRLIMEDYCEAEEKKLNLPPPTYPAPRATTPALNMTPPAAPKPAKKPADGRKARLQ
jgi:hypothetical protein